MKLPKAILLDLDDTIIAYDHGVDLDACWRTACRNRFPHESEEQIETWVRAIRKEDRWFWSDEERLRTGRRDLHRTTVSFVAEALRKCGFDDRDLSYSHGIAVDFQTERDRATALYPGAMEALVYFRELGLKLAIITNGASEPQRRKLHRFELELYFDYVLIEGEFGEGKPAPEVFLHAIQQLGVTCEDTWIIGDNYVWEIQGAAKLGIRGIWVNAKGHEPPQSEPCAALHTVDTLYEVIGILRSWQQS